MLCLLLGAAITTKAQVKVGNNPNTIDPNSLFEMESTNKGLLTPRMALNNLALPAPLTAPVPEGMLIYSIGGTVTDGFYVWTGSKWLALSTSSTTRNNYVLVKSAADLPAPVGGIITLVAGTLYEINGTITLASKIDLNGCKIFGEDGVNDKLLYIGAAELFTGANTGSVVCLTLTAPAGNLFNINAGGAIKNLLMQNCNVVGCNSLGTIQNVGGKVFFLDVVYFANTNGITFQNDSTVGLYSNFWDISNHNTYENFTGKFSMIQVLGGGRNVSSTNTATGLNISGITSIMNGSLKMLLYEGTGTYVTGTFNDNWEVESIGIPTQKDDEATGNCYITTTAPTIFSATNTSVKVLGTTVSNTLFRVTAPVNNRLTYTGRKVQSFKIDCALTASSTGSNQVYSFFIAKNGVILPESEQEVKVANNTDQQSVVVMCTTNLNPGDYLELWAENNTSTNNLTVVSLNMSMK
jgi:hypothetical protein